MRNVDIKTPQEFHVPSLLRSDLIFMTKEGLTQLEEIIVSRHANLYRNKRVPRQEELLSEKYLPEFKKSNVSREWE